MEYTPLQKAQAVLWLHLHNMKILHWNVSGDSFYSNHTYLDEVAAQISSDIDVIAEMGLSNNEHPLSIVNVVQAIAADSVKHPSIDPTVRRDEKTSFTSVMQILDDIVKTYDSLYEANLPRCYTSHIESMQEYYYLQMRYLIPSKFIASGTTKEVSIS